MYKWRQNAYTFLVDLLGDRFQKMNGCKEFFDKDYRLYGRAFIYVRKTSLGSYQLLKVVPLPANYVEE